MLRDARKILEGLEVHPEAMKANLELTNGLVYSGAVLLALARAGISREDAYHLAQRNAMRSWESGEDFRALLDADKEIAKHVGSDELDRCFDASHQLRHVDRILDRALGKKPGGKA